MALPIRPPPTPPTTAPTRECEAKPPTSAPEPAPSAVSVDASPLQAAEAEIVPAPSKAAAVAMITRCFMFESPVAGETALRPQLPSCDRKRTARKIGSALHYGVFMAAPDSPHS